MTPEELLLQTIPGGVEGTCLIWQGTVNQKRGGYGHLSRTIRGSRRAHRVMYMLANELPSLARRALVCHTCDNPPCINPDHLFLGSDEENMIDCAKKSRASLIPDELVFAAYDLYHNSTMTTTEIATQLGVSRYTITEVGLGRTHGEVLRASGRTTFQARTPGKCKIPPGHKLSELPSREQRCAGVHERLRNDGM